jgi:hypothetical protein
MSVKSEAEFIALIGGPYNQLPVTEVTGGGLKRSIDRYPDGTKNEMRAVTGITEYDSLTLKVPYDPAVHDKIMESWSKWCGEAIDISVQPIKVCPEKKADGKMRIYLGCIPSEMKPPEVKRGGNNTAYLELKFEPSGFKIA